MPRKVVKYRMNAPDLPGAIATSRVQNTNMQQTRSCTKVGTTIEIDVQRGTVQNDQNIRQKSSKILPKYHRKSIKKCSKIGLGDVPGSPWRRPAANTTPGWRDTPFLDGGNPFFGSLLGPSWGRLGASWNRLGPLGGLWSLSWARLGACLGLSWPVLACLGLSWPVLTCLGLIFD